MSNIASIISSHNKRLINLEPLCMVATTEREKTGRCKIKSYNDYNIPIWVENNANKGTKIYVDIVETSFKA